MENKFKPKYKVHYDRATGTRSVTIGDNPCDYNRMRHYYIQPVTPAGTKRRHYVLMPKRDFSSRLYPTVRDAIFAILYIKGVI